MKHIDVQIKSVYGNLLIYPACMESRLLSELIGKKTFDKHAIETLQELGYVITSLNGYKLEDATR